MPRKPHRSWFTSIRFTVYGVLLVLIVGVPLGVTKPPVTVTTSCPYPPSTSSIRGE